MAWLRAFALFGLLVTLPLMVEKFLGHRVPFDTIKIGDSFWRDLLSYSGFGVVVILFVGFLLVVILFLPQTYQISEWLTLAEREMNSLLRGWGGGLSGDARKGMVLERSQWLSMIRDGKTDVSDIYNKFFEINQNELATGGGQAGSMSKARFTAFLLREIYEGNVQNAQLKIINEIKNGGKPFIAPGIRQIVDYDSFEKTGSFGAGVPWFPLMLTVKLNHFPREIIMVKPDKTVVVNWAVIDELNRQMAPPKAA